MSLSNTKTTDRIPSHRLSTLRAGTLAFALVLATLGLFGMAGKASAATPTPATVPVPFSWPQWKQSYGTTSSDQSYTLSGTGTPTVLFNLGLLTDATFGSQVSGPGQELRGFILGDYGTTEPPLGTSNFRDRSALSNGNYSFAPGTPGSGLAVAAWAAPFYGLSQLGVQNNNIQVDDNGFSSPNNFTFNGMNQAVGSTTNTDAINQEYYYGTATGSTSGAPSATWTIAPGEPGDFDLWVHVPFRIPTDPGVTSGQLLDPAAVYTYQVYNTVTNLPVSGLFTATADQALSSPTAGIWLQLNSQVITINSSESVIVTLTAGGTNGTEIIADAAELRPESLVVSNTIPGVLPAQVDPRFTSQDTGTAPNVWTANTFDQDYYGADYLSVPAVSRTTFPNGNCTATWTIATVPISAAYDLDVFFPSPYTDSSGNSDTHIDDAQYTITIGTFSQTMTVNQTQGGFFLPIGGPFQIPAGTPVVVTLNNSTNDSLTQIPPPIVVANAIELVADDGTVSGQATAVNITDFPEFVNGYADTAALNTNGTKVGTVSYYAPQVTLGSTENYNPVTMEYVSGETLTQYTAGPVTTAGTYTSPTLPTPLTLNTGTQPIGQIVYCGRVENTVLGEGGNVTPGVATSGGAMYAYDGSTGNPIWRFAGGSSTIVDDTDPAPAWVGTQLSVFPPIVPVAPNWTSATGPDPNFYGSDYKSAPVVSRATYPGNTTQTAGSLDATWSLSALTSVLSYQVFAWFPSQYSEQDSVVDNDSGGFVQNPLGTWATETSASLGYTTNAVNQDYVRIPAVTGPITSSTSTVVWTNPTALPDSYSVDVWYPSPSAGMVLDETAGTPEFVTTGAWQQESSSTTNGTVRDYYGSDYLRAPATTSGTATATATWTFSSVPAGSYTAYAWFPSNSTDAGTTETHIPDATYTLTDNGVSVATIPSINQTVGGEWVPITAASAITAAGADTIVITLANTTTDTNTPVYAVANAIELVSATTTENHVTDAQYEVDINGTAAPAYPTPIAVDQTQNCGQWFNIATNVPVTAGQTLSVKLYDTSASGGPTDYIVADAVRFRPQSDVHITDAEYTVNSVDSTGAAIPGGTIVTIDQTQGGQWVKLPNPNTTDGSWFMGPNGDSVILDNSTNNTITSSTVVVSDAMMFENGQSPSAVYSTPVVVRNMKVLVNPVAVTYEPRDVVIFGDNTGKIFCVDAAGNGDGDDTIVNSTNQAIAFSSTGQPIDPNSTTSPPATLNPPYNLHPVHFGTTKLYWEWDPDPSNGGVISRTDETADLKATSGSDPLITDPNRDMPAPAGFLMNSPTVKLVPDATLTSPQAYDATLFIGNTNGVLYSLDATGVNPITAAQIAGNSALRTTDTQYRYSLEPSEPTLNVNWWFNTGESIAYAPTYNSLADANGQNYVYVTTYNNELNSLGHLYAIDAVNGPIGNGGQGTYPNLPANTAPAEYNYNVNPVSYWSFPDKYGTVYDSQGADITVAHPTSHVRTSTVPSTLKAGAFAPAMPLGDMAGTPALQTVTNSLGAFNTDVYICANDPGSETNGHIYAVNAYSGVFDYAYPNLAPQTTGGSPTDPNTIGSTAEQTTAFTATATGSPGAFTQALSELNMFCSSSPVTGLITLPGSQYAEVPPTVADTYADQQLPVLYVGSTDGFLYALDLAAPPGSADSARLLYQKDVSDGGIYSTPAILPGSADLGSVATGTPSVGGVVFLTTSAGDIHEIEAAPYQFTDTTQSPAVSYPVVNDDWAYSGVGGVSSPSVAGFDAQVFKGSLLGDGLGTTVTFSNAANVSDNSEWVYCGSDSGFTFGFTPNGASGGTNNYNPGYGIPGGNVPPASNTIDLTQNIYVRIVDTSKTTTPLTNTDWTKTVQPTDPLPYFDWGQDIYIEFFNVYSTTANTYPQMTNLRFSLSHIGPGGRAVGPISLTVIPMGASTGPVQQATNLTGWPGGTPATAPYCVVYKYTPGNGANSNQTPGTRITITGVQMIAEPSSAGGSQVVSGSGTGGINLVNKGGTLGAVQQNKQGDFGLLNPLAVTGFGRVELPPTGGPSTLAVQDLGPYSGVTPSTPWSTVKYAATNGNFIPTSSTAPTSDPTGGAVEDPTRGGSTGLVVQTQRVTLAVGLGDIPHGQTTDSGTGQGSDSPLLTAPYTPLQPAVGTPIGLPGNFGKSMLRVGDRSAVTRKPGISIYMDALKLGWADNSGQGGPGSAINMLNWDTPPQAWDYGSVNESPDYPDLPRKYVTAELVARSAVPGNPTLQAPNGANTPVSAQIDAGNGLLIPTDENGGDPLAVRNVYPESIDVTVAVPKYQPPNLEVWDANAQNSYPHTSTAFNPNTSIPQGYVATAHVFVDTGQHHRFIPGDAYRDVQVWVGVPVDMSMSIDEQTTDVGNVPAGFGLNTPTAGTNAAYGKWSPLASGSTLTSSSVPNASAFQNYYKTVTVHNKGNVNLLNVRFDQLISGPDVSGTNYDGSTKTPTVGPFLTLFSDENELPYVVTNQSTWFDSLSYIPSYDNTAALLRGDSSQPPVLIRSSIDSDVYTPNPDEFDLAGNSSGGRLFNNATIHKPRPGDANDTVMHIPDNPHDYGQLTYVAPSGLSVPYNGLPVVSIAVPLGTPVGTYSQIIRAYEESEPFVGSLSTTYSNPFNGPKYQTNPALAPLGFQINNGQPSQYYSVPGTVLKVSVTENRFTDGASLTDAPNIGGSTVAATPLVLPMADTGPSVPLTSILAPGTNPSSGETYLSPANDLQPFAFRSPITGSFGMAFISNRNVNTTTTPPSASPFDLYTSVLATPASASNPVAGGPTALSAPTNTSGTTWWTPPAIQTTKSGDYAAGESGNVRSPFILSDGVDTTMMFWVTTSTIGSGTPTQSTKAIYTIREADVTSIDNAGFHFSSPTAVLDTTGTTPAPSTMSALYSTSQPIFGVKALVFYDTSGGKHLLVFWHTRLGGRAAIYYQVFDMNGTALSRSAGPVDPTTVHPPQQLPVPATLSSVTNPSPVARSIGQVSGGAVTTPSNPNCLDITYSGTSSATGETDIYLSRYTLSPLTGSTPPTLVEQPVVQQNPGNTALLNVSLIRSNSDPSLFVGTDTAWVLDPTYLGLFAVSGGAQTFMLTPGTAVHYTYDRASGQLVYTGISAPWGGTTNVYINAAQGTVRFSNPPPTVAASPWTLTAQAVPLDERITFGSRVNTSPVSLIDEATKQNAPSDGSSPLTLGPVRMSRQWFIWRKSGTAGGDAAAVSSTLYYTTRQLAVNLNAIDPATTSLHMLHSATTGQQVVNLSNFDVEVANTPNMTGKVNVSSLVDVDWSRARINFPSYMEGLYATVAYVRQDGTAMTAAATGAHLQWSFEPYVNAFNPTQVLAGERTVPITTAVNESDPCAFIDPTAGSYPVGSNTPTQYVPHRLWLFWTSARNASTTGADIYYEALDPKFYPE